LATTDVMLASTVQFSRYGRSRPPSALAGATAGPGRGGLAAVPSGPNSVLGPRTLSRAAFLPAWWALARPAGCTSRCELVHGPNNQCSTSEHPPARVPRDGPPGPTQGGSGRVRRTAGTPGAP